MRKKYTKAEAAERQRRYLRRWRKLHPDYFKEWHAANREYVTLRKREYRARKKRGG